MFKKFKITCDEATTICDKSQYGEASLFERIQLNFHFLICKICARYSKQNRKMTEVYKIKATDCKKDNHCLSAQEKENLKKELEKLKA